MPQNNTSIPFEPLIGKSRGIIELEAKEPLVHKY
jgi:hypothetical protein